MFVIPIRRHMGGLMGTRRAAARVALLAMLVGTGTTQSLNGQPETTTPLVNPEIHAVRLSPPPTIDGALDDPAWQAAPETSGFTHERNPPAEETRIRVGYDATHLYFAFRCEDHVASGIRALQTKRNGDMDNDDTV